MGRAIAMLGKVLTSSTQFLLLLCILSLRGEVVAAQLAQLRCWRKEQIMAHVSCDVATNEFIVRSFCFASWAKIAGELKRRDRRQRSLDVCRAIIMRLRDRLIKRLAWDAWLVRALI